MNKATLLIAPLLALSLLGAQAGKPTPESADAAFARKDFKKARDLYRAELAKGTDARKERRVLSCLLGLGEWDEALRDGQGYVARYGDSIDGVRGRRLLADAYLAAPHWGFRDGDVVRRGGERREGEQVWLQEEDQKTALGHLETARAILYRIEDGVLSSQSPRDEVLAEVVATDLALADLVQSRWGFGPMPEPAVASVKDRYFAPRHDWAGFLRADDLYGEVVARSRKDMRSAAVAWYMRALLHNRARPQLEQLEKADRPLTEDERTARSRLGDPVADLRALGERYPGDPLADDAAFAAAHVLEERGDTRGAERAYEEVVARYPASPWAQDARAALQDLRRKDFSFQTDGPVIPGRPQSLAVYARNVPHVAFSAYRLDPQATFLDPARLAAESASLRDTESQAGPVGTQRPAPAATWDYATGDDGAHRQLSGRVPLPPLPLGLYFVEARGEGVTYGELLVVSDLALVVKAGSDDALLYVADAVSGQPVSGASVLIRQRQPGQRGVPVAVQRAQTGEGGTVSISLRKDLDNRYLEALAWSGDRIAATPETWTYRYKQGTPVRVHVTTDRPAYRPGQTVQFRAVAIRASASGEAPLARAKVTLLVHDPRGAEVYRHEHVSDAFGTFSGSLTLGDEPPLGEYPMEIQMAGEGRLDVAGAVFRVEEYRKPDFEVSVDPGPALHAGDKGQADVVARYYFGSPVADAEVTWRAFRTTGWRYYPFEDASEWLYGRGYWGDFWGRPSRALVAQGTARTDASGHAHVEWTTESGQDARYEIEAQVVDLSRREVRGGGSVSATRAAFGLYLRPDRGFYRPGETASIEIAAADANGRAVATQTTLVVFRRTWSALREKVSEDPVFDAVTNLAAAGRGTVRWAPGEAGEYRLVATSFDARQERVTAEALLRVADDGTDTGPFRLSDVELTLDRPTYEQGETAHVLVTSSRPGAVLLTEEAEGQILNQRTLRLGGKGRVVAVALTRAHAPNVFLRATQVGDGRVYEAQRELFVPPAERFLGVALKPRAAIVKPGEPSAIDVLVTDAAGRPVAASLSLAVTDRSIEAIQAPYAPDIRAYFYGGRRGLQVQESSSFQFQASGSVRREAKEAAYRRHGLPPGWWGSLRDARRDWAGDELDRLPGLGALEDKPQAMAEAGAVESGVLGGMVARKAAPASAPAFAKDELAAKQAVAEPEALAEARTRSVFADTAYWNAAITTGPDGRASVTITYPDSLTDWKLVARGADVTARVGEAIASVVVRKNLMVRLQSPRFFVERDRATLSALIQNDLPQAVDAVARISVSDALRLEAPAEARVHVERNGQARVEWPVEVVASGEARIRVSALSAVESDAAEQTFFALVHGVDKQVAQAGRLAAGESRELVFEVPAERGAGTARLTLTVAPTLVSSLLQAIPYLVDYPYGCVEQTMSRFLPAVVLSKTLEDSGAKLEDLAQRRLRLIVADRGLPRKGKDPVFDSVELKKMVVAGLQRLYGFQNGSGGWGWWKGDAGDLRMTAYVVYGLVTARDAGYAVDAAALDRGIAFLEREAKDETSLHGRAYAAFALATARRKPADLDRLLARRADLTVYGKALLALALQRSGRPADAKVVVGNLEDLARVDAASDTASWRVDSDWWWWENDRVETQAFALWALAEVQPAHPLAPKVARWLLLNRQGSQWYSTRDTAHAIYAMTAFAKGAGESGADLTAEVTAGGLTKSFRITPENALAFDDTFTVGDAELGSGRKTIRLRVSGSGALYYNAALRYFTKQEDIRGAGDTLRLKREYWKRVPKLVEAGKERRLDYDRIAIQSLSAVKSGDEVEVKLTIESPTAYDHLVFEDPKPAGFEPIELTSGTRYGDGLCSNMELRDERVAFFISHLAQGTQVIRYLLRAETPGAYHALPARGYAMYAPEIRALADEWRGTVEAR
jgi:uncharacterized protein YfaS (alpha-2-macroglobulin family)